MNENELVLTSPEPEKVEVLLSTPKGTLDLRRCDCMEMMKEFPDGHFDLAIVDPPYGIGMSGGQVGYKGINNLARKDWDNAIPCPESFQELKRASRNQIIWGGNYFHVPPSRCWVIWDKGEGFQNRSYAEAELAWTSFDANVYKIKRDPLANGDYHGKIHPTQKPIFLYQQLLQRYSEPGHRILDTHLGSGSHAIACHYFFAQLTASEIDPDYFREASARIKRETAQQTLF